MSNKSEKIAAMIAQFHGSAVNPRYAAYFAYFNRQLFYEAHDVLEDLWLADRTGPNGAFYKGLIQLAGAFVHLQKNRLGPASALFRLARENLQKYPSRYESLDLQYVMDDIQAWLNRLESQGCAVNPLTEASVPRLAPDG